MTHAQKSYLLLALPLPEVLTPEVATVLRRKLAVGMAEVSETAVEANMGTARELIVRAYIAGHRMVYAGMLIEGAVH